MESRALILFLLMGVGLELWAQKPEFQALGLEAQLYPAGYILGVRYDQVSGPTGQRISVSDIILPVAEIWANMTMKKEEV